MHWLDIGIIGVVGLSAVISLMRGFIQEALSLVGWGASFWMAVNYSHLLLDLLPVDVTFPAFRIIIAFSAMFIVTFIVAALVLRSFRLILAQSEFTGTDRLLGAVFGLVRGVGIISILVFVLNIANVQKDQWWYESNLISYFENFSVWVQQQYSTEFIANYL